MIYTRLVFPAFGLCVGLNIVVISIAVSKATLQTHELLSWLNHQKYTDMRLLK